MAAAASCWGLLGQGAPGVDQGQAAALKVGHIACGHRHATGVGDGGNQQIKPGRRAANAAALHQQIAIGSCRVKVKGAAIAFLIGHLPQSGNQAADRHPAGTIPAGAIALDSAFSPIQRVAYGVENARLGKVTDYEKLILEIWTNGAVSPDDALSRAARHLQSHFSHLAPEGREEEEEEVEATGEGFLQESLAKPLEELPLPARAINALKNHEILMVADLVQKTDEDLESVKNLGSKSIEEIKTALAALGLSLGMRIDPNLLGALGRGGTK